MSETLAADAVMTKGDFAKHIGVSAARVSQYLTEGKIGSDALVGEGRSARIRVAVALGQIRERRDVSQALGNGLFTRLDGPAAPASAPVESAAPAPRPDSIEEQIKREKLRASQMANRKAAEEEEERKGRYTETVAVRAQMARLAASMMQTMEAGLSDMATALAGQFGLPQRDVEHALQMGFRKIRDKAAERHRGRAETLPGVLESVIVAEEDELA